MMHAYSGDQMRSFDRHVIDRCCVPGIVLMENAGRGATDVIERHLDQKTSRDGPVTIICGSGNNGGDGFVVARHLLARGWRIRVLLAGAPEKLTGDARTNYEALRGVGGDVELLAEDLGETLPAILHASRAIVDALLGTGLDREVGGRYRQIIEIINACESPCLSLDIPSGLSSDTGAVLGVAVRATVTITFAGLKLGLLSTTGVQHAGRVYVADLGVPPGVGQGLEHAAEVLESGDVHQLLRARPVVEHKASAGRVVALAGSAGKTGAAMLVARGALRTGAGLVTIATFAEAANSLERRVVEEMTARIDSEDIDSCLSGLLQSIHVVAAGPGFGLDDRARKAVDHVVFAWHGTTVLDADALTQFAGRAGELSRAKGSLILTPHPGEMARLLGVSARDVERDRFGATAECVRLTQATVLLKGPRTLIMSPGRVPIVNVAGTPVLATGGAGDVLTGVVAALGCHLEPQDAAMCAAHLHGRAAEHWQQATSCDRGLLAHEIADLIPTAIASLARSVPTLPL